jgi:hypothetical protein
MTLATKVRRAVSAAKPKPPTEYEIHVAVVSVLHRRHAPGVRWWHTPNEGRRSAKYASGLQLMGVSAGVPDLTLIRARVELPPVRCPACRGSGIVGGPNEYETEWCRVCVRGMAPCVVLPASAVLELKRKGEKPRPEQAAWLEHCAAAGWLTGWASSVDEAVALLEGWGMLAPAPAPCPTAAPGA